MIVMRTVMVVVWIGVLISTALADETVTVNYASVIGPVTYRSAGYLHGPAGPPYTAWPSDAQMLPLKLQQYRTGNHWSRSAIYAKVKTWGVTRIISSLCDDFSSGYICSGGPFPGDGGDWASWETYVGQQWDLDQAAGAIDMIYNPWNEPDASWPRGEAQFFEMWRRTVNVLRGRNPNVKIGGPSNEQYVNVSFMHHFLDYIKATNCGGQGNCYPTYLEWHELANSASSLDILGHVDDARNYMASIGISPLLPISITEYGPSSTLVWLAPGGAVRFMAKFERRQVLANRSCWPEDANNNCNNVAGLLQADQDSATSFQTRSLWWAYKAYADMTGNIVTVTPQANGWVDGLASRAANGSSMILLGTDYGAPAQSVTINLTGLNGVTVMQAVVYHIQHQAAVAVSSVPQVQNTTISITNGQGTVTLPNVGGGDAYQVVLTPASGGDTTAPTAPTALTVR